MASNKINELEEIISEFSESNTDEPNKTKFPMAGNQNTKKSNEIGQCPSSEIPPPPRPLHSLENRKRTLDSCAIDDESFYSAKRSFPKEVGDDQHLSEIQMQVENVFVQLSINKDLLLVTYLNRLFRTLRI